MKKSISTTEVHKHKSGTTQIIKKQIGTRPMPLFGQWKLDEKGNKVPKTWDMPVYQRTIIHHRA